MSTDHEQQGSHKEPMSTTYSRQGQYPSRRKPSLYEPALAVITATLAG
jgi:hypothetical protein